MELQSLLDRARDVVAQRPTFDPKQRMAQAAEQLNRAEGKPVNWTTGIRILGQRHHSETLELEVS